MYRISNGWVAGLVLLYLCLEDLSGGRIKKLPTDIAGSSKLIFNYFEETVFQSLESEIQEFMLKTSLLDILEPDFCNALLHITASEKLLNQLVSAHLPGEPEHS